MEGALVEALDGRISSSCGVVLRLLGRKGRTAYAFLCLGSVRNNSYLSMLVFEDCDLPHDVLPRLKSLLMGIELWWLIGSGSSMSTSISLNPSLSLSSMS